MASASLAARRPACAGGYRPVRGREPRRRRTAARRCCPTGRTSSAFTAAPASSDVAAARASRIWPTLWRANRPRRIRPPAGSPPRGGGGRRAPVMTSRAWATPTGSVDGRRRGPRRGRAGRRCPTTRSRRAAAAATGRRGGGRGGRARRRRRPAATSWSKVTGSSSPVSGSMPSAAASAQLRVRAGTSKTRAPKSGSASRTSVAGLRAGWRASSSAVCDDPLDRVGGEAELLDAAVELVAAAGRPRRAGCARCGSAPGRPRDRSLGGAAVDVGAAAEHRLARPGRRAPARPCRGRRGSARPCGRRARGSRGRRRGCPAGCVLPARADEVVDETSGAGWPWRSMRPLRCSSRVGFQRDLVVHQPVAVALQVDALGGGVGGERGCAPGERSGVCLELGLDALALVGVHAAVEQRDAARRRGRAAVSSCSQPRLGVAVLGEDDDPLVVPPALAVASTSARLRRASRAARSALASGRPCGARSAQPRELVEQLALLGGRAAPAPRAAAARRPRWPRRASASSSTSSSSASNAACSCVVGRPSRRGAVPGDGVAGATSSVLANAAGEENSRFFSSSVTKSAADAARRLGAGVLARSSV